MIRGIKVQQDEELDISNDCIKDIIERSGIKLPAVKQIKLEKDDKKRHAKDCEDYLMEIGKRRWLSKHGRRFLINFDEKERRQMKEYFKALDQKNHGSIGIEELQQLLISVGLAQTREEVKRLIDTVDEDHSGKIQFDQFLDMIQSEGQGQSQDLINFFKRIISGKLDSNIPQGLSFQLMISNLRRRKMMCALNIVPTTPAESKNGLKILQAYKSMNEKRMIRKIREEERRKHLEKDSH